MGWLPLCCCARGRLFTWPEEASRDSLFLPQRGELDETGFRLVHGFFASQAALDLHLASPHFENFQSYLKAKGNPIASQTVTRWQSFD